MKNAMNEDLVITNIAANDNFVSVNLAMDATIIRFTCITSSDSKVIEDFKNRKARIGNLLLGDMVTILITARHVLYDFCE